MNTFLFPEKPVLVVDDESEILEGYSMSLMPRGINNLELCQDSRKVLPMLEKKEYSLIVMDLSMPHITGDKLIILLRENHPDLPVIVVTGTQSIDLAIQCIKMGVYDYMIKPVEINRLVSNIKKVEELHVLKKEVAALGHQLLHKELKNPQIFSSIKTNNQAMKAIFKYMEAIAPTPKPLIITGESGVGKELIARTVHTLSKRQGQFVAINIGGLDDTLFADTLFGHKKGAYTGADKEREGMIKKAEGGTLFLDEIGELDQKSQIKILRLLQENQYFPLGSDTSCTCDIRVIVATNADLNTKQQKGEFRKDLYYRLMTHYVHIPPLRERLDDLPLLIDFFTEKACESLAKPKLEIPSSLIQVLRRYSFPGNIRELESVIYNAASLSNSAALEITAISNYIGASENPGTGTSSETNILSIITSNNNIPTFEEAEEFLIKWAMEQANGNQSLAAPLLGITPSSLCRRLKKLS